MLADFGFPDFGFTSFGFASFERADFFLATLDSTVCFEAEVLRVGIDRAQDVDAGGTSADSATSIKLARRSVSVGVLTRV